MPCRFNFQYWANVTSISSSYILYTRASPSDMNNTKRFNTKVTVHVPRGRCSNEVWVLREEEWGLYLVHNMRVLWVYLVHNAIKTVEHYWETLFFLIEASTQFNYFLTSRRSETYIAKFSLNVCAHPSSFSGHPPAKSFNSKCIHSKSNLAR